MRRQLGVSNSLVKDTPLSPPEKSGGGNGARGFLRLSGDGESPYIHENRHSRQLASGERFPTLLPSAR